MNPFDHSFKVTFGKDSYDSEDSDTDQYIDQCCMMSNNALSGDISAKFTKNSNFL